MISIVIPVYNRAYCVTVCLDSVRKQSFTDWECIVVDDGSTDDTVSVCLPYAESDPRFKIVVQPENGGVSVARNRGLELAQGEYIAFLDSDDWIEPTYLEQLHREAEYKTMPLCCMNVVDSTGKVCREVYEIPDRLYTLDNSMEELFLNHWADGLLGSPVCRLYQRNILQKYHIRYIPQLNWGEDLVFNFTYFKYIDHIKCLPFSLYHIVNRQDSLTSRVRYDDYFSEAHKLMWNVVYEFLEAKNINTLRIEACMNDSYWDFVYKRIAGIYYYQRNETTVKSRFIKVRQLVKQAGKECANRKFLLQKTFSPKQFLVVNRLGPIIWLLYECKYLNRKHK
ncbi:glycosyltransferase family 2 protein [Parabacteroides sp.]